MKKIFILCSGLILAPSMGWADVCSGGYTSLPSGAQLQATVGSSNGCKNYSTLYYQYNETVNGTTTNLAHKYIQCSTCNDGYFQVSKSGKVGTCTYTYSQCTQCTAGTYKSGTSCPSCAKGTYSTTVNASSCTTCPPLSGAYADSDLTTAVNVANGYVTTAGTGSESINECYIIYAARYYDNSGTFSFGGTCAYDGTVVKDVCADITYACLDMMGTQYNMIPGTKENTSSGAACWCNANGKNFYYTTMGSSTSASPSSCEASCYSACSYTIANTTSVRESLGCDE